MTREVENPMITNKAASPGRTRTGKDVYKTNYIMPRHPHWAQSSGYHYALDETGQVALFPVDNHQALQKISLPSGALHFGAAPGLWVAQTPANHLVSEPPAPIGRPGQAAREMFARPERLGVNFTAKSPFANPDLIQIPQVALRFAEPVLHWAEFWRANLPDPRLWPGVEITIKITAGFRRAGQSALDPYLKKAQSVLLHTDGDSVADAKLMQQLSRQTVMAPPSSRPPPRHALAALKQRLIMDSAFPTVHAAGWSFDYRSAPPQGQGEQLSVRSNGYPDRHAWGLTMFPPFTSVAFTTREMHGATYAPQDGHRTVMIGSATLTHGALARLRATHPDLQLRRDAPQSVVVLSDWYERYQREVSAADIARLTATRAWRKPDRQAYFI